MRCQVKCLYFWSHILLSQTNLWIKKRKKNFAKEIHMIVHLCQFHIRLTNEKDQILALNKLLFLKPMITFNFSVKLKLTAVRVRAVGCYDSSASFFFSRPAFIQPSSLNCHFTETGEASFVLLFCKPLFNVPRFNIFQLFWHCVKPWTIKHSKPQSLTPFLLFPFCTGSPLSVLLCVVTDW